MARPKNRTEILCVICPEREDCIKKSEKKFWQDMQYDVRGFPKPQYRTGHKPLNLGCDRLKKVLREYSTKLDTIFIPFADIDNFNFMLIQLPYYEPKRKEIFNNPHITFNAYRRPYLNKLENKIRFLYECRRMRHWEVAQALKIKSATIRQKYRRICEKVAKNEKT